MINLLIIPESVRISTSSVTTQIFSSLYFTYGNEMFFPEEKWDDFSLNVLQIWMCELMKYKNEKNILLFFMDGPYRVRLITKTHDNKNFQLFFIEDRAEEKIIHSEDIEKLFFFKSILRATNQLIRILSGKVESLEQVESLKETFQQFQYYVSTITYDK